MWTTPFELEISSRTQIEQQMEEKLEEIRRNMQNGISKSENELDSTTSQTSAIPQTHITNSSQMSKDQLVCGPLDDGRFEDISVCSIHLHRQPTKRVGAGEYCTLAFSTPLAAQSFRRGMFILSKSLNPKATRIFDVQLQMLHPSPVSPPFQCIVHIQNIRQAAYIVASTPSPLQNAQVAIVRFRFCFRPEYIKVGQRILLRERHTKGIGIICGLVPEEEYTIPSTNTSTTLEALENRPMIKTETNELPIRNAEDLEFSEAQIERKQDESEEKTTSQSFVGPWISDSQSLKIAFSPILTLLGAQNWILRPQDDLTI
jgi:hypothetical protein